MLTMRLGRSPEQQVTNPVADRSQHRILVLEISIKSGLGVRPIVAAAGFNPADLHAAFGVWYADKNNQSRYAGSYTIVDVPVVGEV
jgi:hypothetical protein